MSVHVKIDGQSITVDEDTTIWEAARQSGIDIPVLCHEPRLKPVAVCRLCVVDVGERVLTASCIRRCEEGMNIQTHSERIDNARRTLTSLLLAEHPTPCEREKTTGDCQLEALGREYDLLDGQTRLTPSSTKKDLSSKVIAVDHTACILCDRCIRACDDIQSNHVIGRAGRNQETTIAFDLDQPMGESTCVSCGECAASCPTGALTHKAITLPLRPREETEAIDSVCPYCGVGCTLTYHVTDNQILWAEGRDSPGSAGRLCVKGRYGWDYTHHQHRLKKPLIRHKNSQKGEGGLSQFREASWDEALNLAASQIRSIKEQHGSSSLAGFGSAKCSNEEAYLFQKLIRAGFGTNNVDHCTRLCHASSVAALLEGIGSGAVTDIFSHARESDLILLTGTNTTANHPVAATFFKEAVKNGTKLLIVDPRRPQMADFANWYCQIQPGSDVAFYYALMYTLLEENLIDEQFIAERTENFDALKRVLAEHSPEKMEMLCGIEAGRIRTIGRAVGQAKRMMVFWGMGISQHTHGTDNARCLIALCLMTGNLGRIGTGLHPLRGQNNVQGASDAGLIPMVYPDYQSVADDGVRQKFEQAWSVNLDPTPGLTVVEIMSEAFEGRIKGMFMLGENPFLSDPNINKVRKALKRLDFLAVQDIFLTETAEYADVVFPASSFLEKTGTFTNTDRRVQIGQAALSPPGEARLDWQIICELSTRLGYPMHYNSPDEIFDEMCALTNNYATLSYEHLGPTGKLWPCDDPTQSDGETVLFSDSFPTPSGKGTFVPCQFTPAKELPDDDYPLILNTGRLLEHWHTGTMTRRAQVLDALQPIPFVEMNAEDMTQLQIQEGEKVKVSSRRGEIQLEARHSSSIQRGSVFIPFHFREAAANELTIDALDPDGKIPELKFCAVRIEPIEREQE